MTPDQRTALVGRLRACKAVEGWTEELIPDPLSREAADALESDSRLLQEKDRQIAELREALAKIAAAELIRHADGRFEYAVSFANRMIKVAREAVAKLAEPAHE